MGKPPAPDTFALHLPAPTGRDAHDSPFWRVGPVLISVGVIDSGDNVGRHGVFVDSFGPVPAGSSSLDVAAAVVAADRAAKAADARADAAHTRAQDVEAVARTERTVDLVKALHSAEDAGDAESVAFFTDVLAWQRAHPLEGAPS